MLEENLIFLCFAAFGAGFIDSIVGGGGLIQLPALMLGYPHIPVVALLGTNKLISFTGTAFATYRYSRQIPYVRTIIFPAMLAAFAFAFLGAYVVSAVSSEFLKPLFMVLMLVVFFLTIRNKHFGMKDHDPAVKIPLWKPLSIGVLIGFYDGFFGPGTGTLLILGFVGLMGMTFVQGSAYAKMINLTTNVAAISLFALKGTILWNIVFTLMFFNAAGSVVGVRLALLKGNEFVRGLLRFIVLAMILKVGIEVWRDYF
jgi:uncharacterized membrane protein YfcA